MDTIDSKEIPSIGYPLQRNLSPADQQQLSVFMRKWAVWTYQKIKQSVDVSPKIETLQNIAERQEIQINKLTTKLTQALSTIDHLETRLKDLETKTEEYRNWEELISNHVASVDQKAGSIEKLRSLIYAIWDVTIQTVEPDIEKAQLLVKSYNHLINLGPGKRSFVKGDDISKLTDNRKRWSDNS